MKTQRNQLCPNQHKHENSPTQFATSQKSILKLIYITRDYFIYFSNFRHVFKLSNLEKRLKNEHSVEIRVRKMNNE